MTPRFGPRRGAAVAAICSGALLSGCSASSESRRDEPAHDSVIQTAARELPPEATEVWEPEPAVVRPGDAGKPPSDAVVLFDEIGRAHV